MPIDMMHYYTGKDPHYELFCTSCRFGDHDCAKNIIISGGLLAGSYRCGCTQCVHK